MKTTKNFNNLEDNLKNILLSDQSSYESILSHSQVKMIHHAGDRSMIYELVEHGLILKIILPKGFRDQDIEALIDLDGLKYFPKLYAYEPGKFLLMDKVKGESLTSLISEEKISHSEINQIRSQYEESVRKGIEHGRYDWDMKLEHFYWDKHTQTLQLIDLGIYDPFPNVSEEFTERNVKSQMNNYNEKLAEMGITM